MFAPTERRLDAEWELLRQLATVNPGRLTDLRRESVADFRLRLHGPTARSASIAPACHIAGHDLRFEFPVHFPAVPMELYLRIPVFHPNVHPENGFVCLWQQHRVSNSVEHALHKLVAMLSGRLFNAEPLHVMQPDALPCSQTEPMPLRGIAYEFTPIAPTMNHPRRKRLL